MARLIYNILLNMPVSLNQEMPEVEPNVASHPHGQLAPPSLVLRSQWLEKATELFSLHMERLSKGWRYEKNLYTDVDIAGEVVDEEEGV